jgi:hypothetical protein
MQLTVLMLMGAADGWSWWLQLQFMVFMVIVAADAWWLKPMAEGMSELRQSLYHVECIAGHRHRGQCRWHRHSGILYISPVPNILVSDWVLLSRYRTGSGIGVFVHPSDWLDAGQFDIPALNKKYLARLPCKLTSSHPAIGGCCELKMKKSGIGHQKFIFKRQIRMILLFS